MKKQAPSISFYNKLIIFILFVFLVVFFYMIDLRFSPREKAKIEFNEGSKLMYTSTSLNVRNKPSKDSRKIKTLKPNTPILTNAKKISGWVLIGDLDSNKLGYVFSKYLVQELIKEINHLTLPPSKLDIGLLTAEYIEDSANSFKDFLEEKLSKIINSKNNFQPRDIVLPKKKVIKPKKIIKKKKRINKTSDGLLAYSYAEDFVKRKLTSPSSAEFPSIWDGKKDHVVSLGYSKYKIRSYVDSQNGFGAMLRTQWSCIITIKGNSAECENLIMN